MRSLLSVSRCGASVGVLLRSARLSSTTVSGHEDGPAASTARPVLPGEDLARRVVVPNASFSATWTDGEALSPEDPRVEWKEYFSLEKGTPYYHNIKTNETTYEIPQGFVTRFPNEYRTRGYQVDASGVVHREPEATAAPTAVESENGLTMKQRLARYGGGGLLWYLIIHNICLMSVFISLYFLRIDLVAIARSYGFHVRGNSPDTSEAEVATAAEQDHRNPKFWRTLLLSIVLNKMMVPMQLFVTLTTAPFLVPRLQPVAKKLAPKFKAFVAKFKS